MVGAGENDQMFCVIVWCLMKLGIEGLGTLRQDVMRFHGVVTFGRRQVKIREKSLHLWGVFVKKPKKCRRRLAGGEIQNIFCGRKCIDVLPEFIINDQKSLCMGGLAA